MGFGEMGAGIVVGVIVWLIPIAIAVYVVMQIVAIRRASERMANALEAMAARDDTP